MSGMGHQLSNNGEGIESKLMRRFSSIGNVSVMPIYDMAVNSVPSHMDDRFILKRDKRHLYFCLSNRHNFL